MNGVEQIRFTYAIKATNTRNPFREAELPVGIIFELEQRYGMQEKRQRTFV